MSTMLLGFASEHHWFLGHAEGGKNIWRDNCCKLGIKHFQCDSKLARSYLFLLGDTPVVLLGTPNIHYAV